MMVEVLNRCATEHAVGCRAASQLTMELQRDQTHPGSEEDRSGLQGGQSFALG